MKSALITIDMQEEKVEAITFFEGEGCWKKASGLKAGIEPDYPKPRYHNIVTSDHEAKIAGLAKYGITGLDASAEGGAA